jgi:hypothetical protein
MSIAQQQFMKQRSKGVFQQIGSAIEDSNFHNRLNYLGKIIWHTFKVVTAIFYTT